MADKVSIKDVAREANTSIATVSNVLNQKKNVSPELQARVNEAIDRLSYRANVLAKSLKTQKTRMIGVIASDSTGIFFCPTLNMIQEGLYASGYTIMLCGCNNDLTREAEYARLLETRQADAIIRSGISGHNCEQIYSRLVKKGIPVVSIEHDFSDYGVDSVLVDNRECAYRAVSHLIEVGCRRIVHISFTPRVSLVNDRWTGYKDALDEAGIPYDPSLVVYGDFSAVSGYRAIQELIHNGVRFDGIFAANDQMAVGALHAMQSAGISVPGDVRLVGFDNTFIASIVNPAITVISVSATELGRLAVKRVLERLNGLNTEAAKIPMDYELVIRQSTMMSARTQWDLNRW